MSIAGAVTVGSAADADLFDAESFREAADFVDVAVVGDDPFFGVFAGRTCFTTGRG